MGEHVAGGHGFHNAVRPQIAEEADIFLLARPADLAADGLRRMTVRQKAADKEDRVSAPRQGVDDTVEPLASGA